MQTATAATLPPLELKTSTGQRFANIDLLRGLVMIIMALDHTRDFVHIAGMTGNPLDLETTTPALFFTRWITHFCAPIFVFLAGSSAWFQSLRKSKKELSWFLVTRGLWLIFMEVAIVNLLFTFDPTYTVIGIQTIWAIGISMVILGLVILLPFPLIAALGFLIVLGHNSLDFYEARHERQPISFFYDLMHRVNFYPMGSGRTLLILYPFLPWTGLMILGYCFGKMFTGNNPVQRNKLLLRTALIVITGFIALRALNIYGNPEPWEAQKNAGYTLLSFIDTHKYPPSLAYMLMTIGPGILFLALVRNTRTALAKFVIVYGRVPFFYYLAHFLLIHLIATAIFFARGHSFQEGITGQLPSFVVAGEGFNLFWTYIVWIAVVVALYPVCKWYDTYKTNHKEKWWLSYL